MRIAIIGNGILGLTISYEILKISNDVEIDIFGRAFRPSAGSNAAAAMLNSFAELEAGYFENKVNSEHFEHSKVATSLWPEYISELQDLSSERIPHGFGTFVIANNESNEIESENFQAILDALNTHKAEHHLIDVKEIPGLKPSREGRSARAVFIQREGWVDANPLLTALEGILKKSQRIKFVDREIREIREHSTNGEIKIIDDSNNEFFYEKVVLAAGAKSRYFMKQIGLTENNPDILYGIGTTIRIKTDTLEQKNVIRTPNRGLACGLYSAPYIPNEIVLGATNQVSDRGRQRATVEDVRSILAATQKELNHELYSSQILNINTGYRPISTDGIPLIGQAPLNNVFLCTGTRRDGWHLSPFLGKNVAKIVLNKKPISSFYIYQPNRIPYRFLSVEKSIETATRHYVSGMYQHDLRMPFGAYRRHIYINYENYFRNLHEYAGLSEYGIPIDLIGYCSDKMAKGEEIKL